MTQRRGFVAGAIAGSAGAALPIRNAVLFGDHLVGHVGYMGHRGPRGVGVLENLKDPAATQSG